jgi:hypothetical protein
MPAFSAFKALAGAAGGAPPEPLSVTITFPSDLQNDSASFLWTEPSVGDPGTVVITGGALPYSFLWTFTDVALESISNETEEICTLNTSEFGHFDPSIVTLTVTDDDSTVEADSADVFVAQS